jgi:hypothetical protein
MKMKKLITIVAVVFVVYFLVTQPEGMANTLGDIGGWFGDVFEAIIRFFTELF